MSDQPPEDLGAKVVLLVLGAAIAALAILTGVLAIVS
jgi:hypothetical protein